MALFQPGEPVWYAKQGEEDEGAGVFEAVVVSCDAKSVKILVEDSDSSFNGQELVCDNSEIQNFAKGNVYAKDREFDETEGYDDMVLLRNLNDAELNRNLKIRFQKDLSYCYCGNTCVAINLFYRGKSLDDKPKDWRTGQPVDCFSQESKALYVGKPREANPPHIYAIVEEGFNAMLNTTVHGPPKKQAIVITGESGAGKTFTTYKVLDYIDTINQASCLQNGKEPTAMTAKIRATMPIMDAFGNATMPRNDDSSRFGKLYRIVFDKRSKEVVGAMITPYLLEKSRVCAQASWERGFHIFYQLIYGSDAAMKQKYKLKNVNEYHYLNRHLGQVPSSADSIAIDNNGDVCLCHVVDRSKYPALVDTNAQGKALVDDAKNFTEDTLPALTACGFSEAAIEEILSITSGILMLGNIPFNEDPDESRSDATILDDEPLNVAAELLKIDKAQLKNSLLHGKTGKHITNYSNLAARRFRDGLARAVYNDMFVEIIRQLSSRLSQEVDLNSPNQTYMAVLDIFGFEFVEEKKLVPGKLVNSLEQFCINLCNEKLQNHFVECVFLIEIKNLTDEGCKVTAADFDFTPNDAVLEMLQSSGKSVVHELDDVCKNPSNAANTDKADLSFRDRLDKKFAKPTEWTIKGRTIPSGYAQHRISRRTYQGNGFKIRHYANEVLYDVSGWVEKNLDRVPSLCYDALCESTYLNSGNDRSILQTFKEDRAPPDQGGHGKKRASPASLVSHFKLSLADLVDLTLTSNICRNQFVRCIKPNTVKKPQIYTSALVLNQLQYTGMLDTLRIRKAGYPTRPLHQDFYDKYKPLAPDATDATSLVDLLRHRGADYTEKSMFYGTTRVLMKDELARAMDAERGEMLRGWCLILQTAWRGAANKRTYQSLHHACSSVLPEIRRTLVLATLVQGLEVGCSASAEASTRAFLLENVGMLEREKTERITMMKEEDYAREVELQRMMSKLGAKKAGIVDDARGAYEQYKRAVAVFDQSWKALQEEEDAAAMDPISTPVPGKQIGQPNKYPHSTKFKFKSGRVNYLADPGSVVRAHSTSLRTSTQQVANNIVVTEL